MSLSGAGFDLVERSSVQVFAEGGKDVAGGVDVVDASGLAEEGKNDNAEDEADYKN